MVEILSDLQALSQILDNALNGSQSHVKFYI